MRETFGFFEWVFLPALGVRLPRARRLAHGRVVVDVAVDLEVDRVLLLFEALSPHVEEAQDGHGAEDEHGAEYGRLISHGSLTAKSIGESGDRASRGSWCQSRGRMSRGFSGAETYAVMPTVMPMILDELKGFSQRELLSPSSQSPRAARWWTARAMGARRLEAAVVVEVMAKICMRRYDVMLFGEGWLVFGVVTAAFLGVQPSKDVSRRCRCELLGFVRLSVYSRQVRS